MNDNKYDQGSWFRRRDAIDETNDIETIEIVSSDDDTEVQPPPPPPPAQQQQQQNYNPLINSSAQNELHVKQEIVHDSVHLGMSQFNMHQDGADNGQMVDDAQMVGDHFDETYNTQSSSSSSSDDLIPNLKTKYRYNEQKETTPRLLLDMARTPVSPPTAAASPMVTSTTAPMMSATPSPLPNSNYSSESQSNYYPSGTSRGVSHVEVSENVTKNLSFDDFFKNNSAESNESVTQLIESKIKQHMQQAMANLMAQYDFVPKNSAAAQQKKDADLKRKHYHKSKKNADSKRGHEHHRQKKERWESYSSESSLDDLFGPSTSTPKPSGNIKKNLLFLPSVVFCPF